MFRCPQKQTSGFSLLEFLTTILISTILISLAVPAFNSLLEKTRLTTHTNLLLGSLYSARTYAITKQVKLLVCMRKPDNTCASHSTRYTNWQDGWIVFQDINDNLLLDDGEAVHIERIDTNLNIIFNQTGSLRFHPDGSARSAGFYLCNPDTETHRHVSLLYSGRARVDKELTDAQQQRCKSA